MRGSPKLGPPAALLAVLALAQAAAFPFSDDFKTLDCDPACNVPATMGPANEVTIAADPINPAHLIVASKDYGLTDGFNKICSSKRVWIRVSESHDGGASWSSTYAPGWNGSVALGDYDCTTRAALAFDRVGNAFLAGLAFNSTELQPEAAAAGAFPATTADLFIAARAAGGASWIVRTVLSDCAEGPRLAADTISLRVYVVWLDTCTVGAPQPGLLPAQAFGYQLLLAYSDDGGAIWSQPKKVGTTGLVATGHGASIAVGPLGQAYVAWRDLATGSIMFSASADSGSNWITLPAAVCMCQGDAQTWQITRGYRYFSAPSIGVDTSFGPNHGTVYIAYTDVSHQRGLTRVVASRTGGLEWTVGVPNNDIATLGSGAGGLASAPDDFMPTLAVGPNGHVHVAYYTTREGGGSGSNPFLLKLNTYYAHSLDGLLWDPNVRLSTGALDPTFSEDESGRVSIGDYMGLAATANAVRVVWTDTRTGQPLPLTATVLK